MARTNTGRWSIALVTAMVIISDAACGSAQSAGPLQTLSSGGQPYLAMASSDVVPGQPADAEAYVVNSAKDSVQITGVSAVPVSGEPTGRVMFVGLQSTGASLASGHGWPPEVPVKPAIGAELPHGEVGIIFGIIGPAGARHYAIAGLLVHYKYHGALFTTVAWAGEAGCVADSWRPGASNWKSEAAACQAFTEKVNGILEKTAAALVVE